MPVPGLPVRRRSLSTDSCLPGYPLHASQIPPSLALYIPILSTKLSTNSNPYPRAYSLLIKSLAANVLTNRGKKYFEKSQIKGTIKANPNTTSLTKKNGTSCGIPAWRGAGLFFLTAMALLTCVKNAVLILMLCW